MNQVYLLGRLGQDPEDINGKGAKFSLATNKKWKDKDGQWQEQTTWHNVVVWGPASEYILKNIKRGEKVLVDGEIEVQEYEKDGEQKKSFRIKARRVEHFSIPNRAPGSDDGGF